MNSRQRRILLACPLLGFVVLAFVLTIGFDVGRHDIHPSSMLGKPIPFFELQTLQSQSFVSPSDLHGKPRLINVWASWCAACRFEHSLFHKIAESGQVSLIGVNYKDQRNDALSWLYELGDPYEYSIIDANGDLGVDLGVYGAPESFLLDAAGIIRYKHVGPLTEQIWVDEIEPLLNGWN